MINKKKLIAVLKILLVLFISFYLARFCISLSFNMESSYKTVKKEASPDGVFTAYAFIINGGATTDFGTGVSILRTGEKFENEAGNVFRGCHTTFIDFKWEDSSNLIIYHEVQPKDIFLNEFRKNNINIKYIKTGRQR